MPATTGTLEIPFVIGGRTVYGSANNHGTRIGERFTTPELTLDELVLPRTEPGPAFDTPLAEILDLLQETGRRLDLDTNPYLAEAREQMTAVSPHSARVVENCYRGLAGAFDRDVLGFQVDRELGPGVIDGWVTVHRPHMHRARVRAFPSRLIHIMPGNGPGAASITITRAAITKSFSLLKLPSNDLCTAVAILRTMADIDPNHPVVRSFSSVYWRGGDETVEGALMRPQYFDKLVAWGGESAIRSAVKYIGPGFELISFDPKLSISMIGREAFTDDNTMREVARAAAKDVNFFNQEACASSRHHFVEGTPQEIQRYCAALAEELAVDQAWGDGKSWDTPAEIREQVEVLVSVGVYDQWGDYEGRGLVVRSDEPVGFHPIAKTVNVVPVKDLTDALPYVTVATQTVGLYPPHRKTDLRDRLVCCGAQRVVTLGSSVAIALTGEGLPHDGWLPLQRLVRWVSDED